MAYAPLMKSAVGKTISLEAHRWAVSQSLQDAQSPTEVNKCVSPFVCNSAGFKCTFAYFSIWKHAGARERVSSLVWFIRLLKTFLEREFDLPARPLSCFGKIPFGGVNSLSSSSSGVTWIPISTGSTTFLSSARGGEGLLRSAILS